MSDTGSNQPYDPYDPNRPRQPEPPQPEPPQTPQWGSSQPPPGQQPYGQPQYGQPQYGQQAYGQPAGSPPPNYLVWSILSTVLCCLPLGIASIVFAAQVNGKFAAGDIAGAQEASRKAKQFAIWSAVAGLVVGVLYLILAIAVGVGASST
ncbi:MAG: CD225/dispanin family protein [Actinomycetes bacterium]